MYLKPSTSIICIADKLKPFAIRSGVKRGCPLSPLLFNIVLEILSVTIREEKEIDVIKISNDKFKLSHFADYIRVYLKNPRK